jgi:hypothetical protein
MARRGRRRRAVRPTAASRYETLAPVALPAAAMVAAAAISTFGKPVVAPAKVAGMGQWIEAAKAIAGPAALVLTSALGIARPAQTTPTFDPNLAMQAAQAATALKLQQAQMQASQQQAQQAQAAQETGAKTMVMYTATGLAVLAGVVGIGLLVAAVIKKAKKGEGQ